MPSLIIKIGGTYTMSGKYMKIKRVIIPTLTMVMISSMLFGVTACGKKDTYNMLQESTEIELEYAVPDYDSNTEESKVELLPWLQLSSLETHPELRTAFEELIGVTTEENGTKSGIVYNDENGDRNQNNTLFNALGNTSFTINCIRDAEQIKKLEEIANNEYTDIEENQGVSAVINAYFELLPDQEDGQFDGDATISRAQAMTLVMRATTPVNEAQAPEEDADFTKAVGETQYTNFAAPMNDYCYINTSNGLNEKSFESTMSRGEYIYMLTKALFGDEYSSRLEEAGKEETDVDSVTFTTLKDGGDVTYQEALSSTDKGLPTDMFNTFKKAAIGFVTEDSLNWDEAITKSEAINLFIDAVEVYQTNTGSVNTEPEETNGNTAGDLYVPTEEDNQIEDEASQAIAEATKADEQLQSEAGQTTSEESNYTVTPMTATLYAQQAVNLRQGPGTNYDKTGSLSTNQSVEVTGYTDVASGKWYQLSNGSFVSSKYLSTDKVAVQAPTTNTNNKSSNSSTNNSSNSGGSNQSSSSSSEGQTVTGIGATGDGSGSSRANRSAGSDGSGGIGGNWNLQ